MALAVVGTSAAGSPFRGTIQAGEAVRIFTGAAVPDGADTILVQEEAARDGHTLTLDGEGPPHRGAHVRAFSRIEADHLLIVLEALTALMTRLAADAVRAGVLRYLQLVGTFAPKVMEFPLQPEHESGNVFRPVEPRDAARLLIVDRGSEPTFVDRRVLDLPRWLQPGDALVFNDTKVIPARVFSDDGKIELLCLDRLSPVGWRCLVRPGKRMKACRV